MEEKLRVYEQDMIHELTEGVIRPGGLPLTKKAVEICEWTPKSKVLDVGCGNGLTVEYLIRKYRLDAVGIDPSEKLLNEGLERNSNLKLLKGCGENLPFSDNEMDGVLAECSLSVMEDMDKALSEFYRVLKKNGKLIISDLYIRSNHKLDDLPFYCCVNGALPRQELENKLDKNNFKIIHWEDCTEELKKLVFNMIMNYGSVEKFWKQMIPKNADCKEISNRMIKAKLGYFLLIAQKIERS